MPVLSTTDDLRIKEIKELSTPAEVMREIPRTLAATRVVTASRNAVHAIRSGPDDRLVVVVGPCSIHDPVAALDYAARLAALREKLSGTLEIIMRVYFEKPRTTVGWKGLINDPDLDGSFHIDKGLRLARGVLVDVNNLGLPAACEFLDMTTPQYIADLVSWAAIGARSYHCANDPLLANQCVSGAFSEVQTMAILSADAVVQATGAVLFIVGVASGHDELVRSDLAGSVRVSPRSVGANGFGVGVDGRF
jgi:phospho-2-dehydro-3-deoxyheptonate aldolase